MDVPPNVALLPKVAISIVLLPPRFLKNDIFSEEVKSDMNEFTRAQLSTRIKFR